ncbi:hypothetical protein HRI_003234800 [Hibiscus trionum]|uniref:Fe2OG dioxygenase domain-containing protein n=1 Tax=Hibiscus trionum TaxID=183268 RepID=A0A9W7IG68_HIBTR|nr:hypothetical protein HRI_003234800 [Hibiscus trionum]
MADALQLPVVDLSSPDRFSAANSIRQACIEHGFFYLVNHGVDEELVKKVLEQSSKFFSLPIEDKMKLVQRSYRGYVTLYAGKLDITSSSAKADSREGFYIGPLADELNQWPLEEDLPSWRSTMETYYQEVLSVGTELLSLIALSLRLDEDYFKKLGALNDPLAIIGLLHYPGGLDSSNEEIYGASAHSDFGMITLLATDGVPGLQICREKTEQPPVWEDVPSMSGAFIVNIGDMMERWTNCLFRSTVHRVLPPGQERYSVAFFANPNKDCIIECFESCCSESCPPRFPPIKYLDYRKERLRLSYGF